MLEAERQLGKITAANRDLAKLALALERELHRHPTHESRFPGRNPSRTAAEIPRRPGHPPPFTSEMLNTWLASEESGVALLWVYQSRE